MAGRSRHKDKHIEVVLQYAEECGWRVEKASGGSSHCWGMMYCSKNDRTGCKASIHSTPRTPQNHARHLRGEIDMCEHCDIDGIHINSQTESEPSADDETTKGEDSNE